MSNPNPVPASATPTPVVTPTPAAVVAPASTPEPITQTPQPSNWRLDIAGTNTEHLKTLERFASPKAMFDSYQSMRQRMSSGELKSTLPKDATPEQTTAWRAENGIPETPDKYDLTFEDGLVVGEEDKPIINHFLSAFHKANYTGAQAKEAVRAYYDLQTKEAEALAEDNKATRKEVEDKLRSEWGNDYRANRNSIDNLLNAHISAEDADLKNLIVGGIETDARFARFLANLSLQLNPHTTLVPGAAGNVAGAIDDEISQWKTKMADKGSDYWKGPNAEKNQKRYRDLVDASLKQKK